MRLEDWQKWLDSQFVGSPATTGEPAAPAAGTSTEAAAAASVHPPRLDPAKVPEAAADTIPSLENYLPGLRRSSEQAPVPQGSAEQPAAAESTAPPASEVQLTAAVSSQQGAETPAPAQISLPDPQPAAILPEADPGLPAPARTETRPQAPVSADAAAPAEPAPPPPAEQEAAKPEAAPPPAPAVVTGVARKRSVTKRRTGSVISARTEVDPIPEEALWTLAPRHLPPLVHNLGAPDGETHMAMLQRVADPKMPLDVGIRTLSLASHRPDPEGERYLLHMPATKRNRQLSSVLAFLEEVSVPPSAPR